MTRSLTHEDDVETTIATGHDTDGTLPIELPEGARPDWIITASYDEEPFEPEGDYFPYTITFDGTMWTTTANTQYAPWVSAVDEVQKALTEFDLRHRDPWAVLTRYFKIFHDQEVGVFEGPYGHRFVSMPTPEWREIVGFTPEAWCNHDAPGTGPGDRCECGEIIPATPAAVSALDDCYADHRAYHSGEVFFLTLWTFDETIEEYVLEDQVGGFYGMPEADHARDTFGKSAPVETARAA